MNGKKVISYENVNSDILINKKVDLEQGENSIFISEHNQLYFYLGYYKPDARLEYYSLQARNKKVKRIEKKFIRLKKGILYFDDFLDAR